MNARGITVDGLNFYQPRRERIVVLQRHGFAPKSHSCCMLGSLSVSGPSALYKNFGKITKKCAM